MAVPPPLSTGRTVAALLTLTVVTGLVDAVGVAFPTASRRAPGAAPSRG